jgi:hypothetical protein
MNYCIDLSKNNKILRPKKSIIKPVFYSKNILVNNSWDYVNMWLKKNRKSKALIYWQQAKQFYYASLVLPNTSSPLTNYYCFLNAVKALLIVKEIEFKERHGVTGYRKGNISFDNEIVIFKQNGILPSLQKYFDETIKEEEYSLKQLLQNLVFIHRVYTLTYTSSGELFIPVKNIKFVKAKKYRSANNNYKEFWLSAEFDNEIVDGNTAKQLSNKFKYIDNNIVSNKRFKWHTNLDNINELISANKYYRKHFVYIKGLQTHWYLKKDTKQNIINKSMPTMIYVIMHRLSELSRYNPEILTKYFESKNNWLLAEFLDKAKYQFIDQISSEITGYDFVTGKNFN